MSAGAPLSARSGGRRARQSQRRAAAESLTMSLGTPLGVSFKPLQDADLQRVHRAALDLLERIGMADPTARVRDLALSKGCRLTESGRLLFPRALVEDALATAAKRFTVHGRDPAFDFEAAKWKGQFLHRRRGGENA